MFVLKLLKKAKPEYAINQNHVRISNGYRHSARHI